MPTPEDILEFWFTDALIDETAFDAHLIRWFRRHDAFDRAIVNSFGDDIRRGGSGELDLWTYTARGRLALIILLDQMTRNAFRGSAKAYAFDARATELCLGGLAVGANRELKPIEQLFFYMPLLHSENLSDQQRGVECFEYLRAQAPSHIARHFAAWVGTARRHRAIIRHFGRFPHRNAILGRKSTVAELAFLGISALRATVARKASVLRRGLARPFESPE